MSIIQLPENLTGTEVSSLITRYLTDPSDNNFHKLSKYLVDDAKLSDLIYSVCLSPPLKAKPLQHLMKCLFLNGRFIEVIYYLDIYRENSFAPNKEVERIYAMSLIEAGWLITEEKVLEECIRLGENKHHELTLRLAYCLRSGNLERAHDLSIGLLFEENCSEHGYTAIVDTAIHVEDLDLLFTALNDAKSKGIELKFGKIKNKQIFHLLMAGVIKILKSRF